jgi:hypothetical protein
MSHWDHSPASPPKVYVWFGSVVVSYDSHSLTRRCGLSPTLAAPSFLFKGRGGNPVWQG